MSNMEFYILLLFACMIMCEVGRTPLTRVVYFFGGLAVVVLMVFEVATNDGR